MIKLKLSLRNKAFAFALLLGGFPVSRVWGTDGVQPAGGANLMVKDLIASSGGGTPVQGSGYMLDFSLGESAAGHAMNNSTWMLSSGYLAVRLGVGQTLRVAQTQVGYAPFFYHEGLQVGATVQAAIQINFSDQLDAATLEKGINVAVLQDHLGQPVNTSAQVTLNYDPTGTRLVLMPQPAWQGNTLYSVVINKNLLSLDGYSLDSSTSVPFMTALDPQQENVVSNRSNVSEILANKSASAGGLSGTRLTLNIPPGALSDFAMVLFSQDPLNSPLRVDPSIVREANQKAQTSGGMYRSPVALGEIAAYNLQGRPLRGLAMPAQASLSYSDNHGLLAGPSVPVRSSTLSMWALDQAHHLWVKMPASTVNLADQTVSAPMSQFAVFALMGGMEGSASDVHVFPNPWRPHGPNSGEGAGQTGTEAGGMTFNNLPSECTIHIYTLSQERVRTLRHSDAGGTLGQEKWDGLTGGGAHAASGVYLWRVESSVDGKNGKLMIIR